MNSELEIFTDIELFPENEALPEEWDFILEPNIELEFCATMQLQVKYGQEVKRIALSPSTLSGEYSLVHLQRLIVSAFNLKKNSLLQIFCFQTNSVLQTDTQFLEAFSKVAVTSTSPLALKVSLIQEEEPCILCVSYECRHSTNRTFGKKRKLEQDTLLPSLLEPVSFRADKKEVPKRRKLGLSGSSVPKTPLSVSHSINASFPKQILVNF